MIKQFALVVFLNANFAQCIMYVFRYVSMISLCHLGQCEANDQYIGQLKETFATSLPSRIAAFFAEPIQVPSISLTVMLNVKIKAFGYTGFGE